MLGRTNQNIKYYILNTELKFDIKIPTILSISIKNNSGIDDHFSNKTHEYKYQVT